jgi:hypothetical protein
VSEQADTDRVITALRAYGVDVDRPTAAALAAEARDRDGQMARLLDYDLTGVDSAVELTRRGRR